MTITPRLGGPQARPVDPRSSTASPVEDSSSVVDASVGLIVEYADTTDMDDGQPLPPLILDGAVWRVVRRLDDARTRWCRIALAEYCARSDGRQVARDFISGRQSRQHNS